MPNLIILVLKNPRVCSSMNIKISENTALRRPGGTGPVGPAMAGPTFELGRTFLNSKQNCELLRIKSVYNKRRPLLTENSDKFQPTHLG